MFFNSIGGLRAETEAVRALKSINAFLKSESKRHYKYYVGKFYNI